MTALLIVIFIAFVSLGFPDSLFGVTWPVVHVEFGLPENFGSVYSVVTAVSTGGIAFSKEIGLTANTSATVEVWNGLSEGSKVKEVRIDFVNGEGTGLSFRPLGKRTVEIMGIRLR